MALIEFKDLPDTSTPINAENLNKIQKSNVYSTDEIEIGKLGNKKLYRKVITVGSVAATTWTNVLYSTLNISNVDFAMCEWGRMNKGNYIYEDLFSQQNRVQYLGNGLSLWLSESAQDITMSLIYTKTTD